MNTLIQITPQFIGHQELNSVNARELHENLGIKKDFSNWIKAQIDRAGLELNVDFVTHTQKGVGGKFDRVEYILTIEAAKHIAMMSQSQKGKEIRDYFVEVEKKYHSRAVIPTENTQMMQAVLSSLNNIGEVVQALGMQMERLDRRLQSYEEREHYKREKARLRAERYATGNKIVTAAYEGRRLQFVKLVQEILKGSKTQLNQSQLLIKAGYRRDDNTARKWLGEGMGIYWRVQPDRNKLIYSLIEVEEVEVAS